MQQQQQQQMYERMQESCQLVKLFEKLSMQKLKADKIWQTFLIISKSF